MHPENMAGAAGQVRRLIELRRFSGFAHLAPEHLAALAERAEERFFPAGTCVFREHEPVSGTHFILEGSIRVRRHGHDLRTFTGREVVGGLATLQEEPGGLDALAVEDTWTLELPAEDMTDVIEENWAIFSAVLRSLAKECIDLRRSLGPLAGFIAEVQRLDTEVGELDLVERLSFLRSNSPFEKGSIESMAELARDARQVRFASGERLWSQGDSSGWHLRILRGVVRCRADDGRQEFRFGHEDVVGAMDSSAQLDRWYDAVAETEVVALRVETERLLDVMEDHTDLGMALLRMMAAMIEQLLEALAGHIESAHPALPPTP